MATKKNAAAAAPQNNAEGAQGDAGDQGEAASAPCYAISHDDGHGRVTLDVDGVPVACVFRNPDEQAKALGKLQAVAPADA